ncbi:galanin receptor type 2-like [Brachyhypopomus gauderio]|uniref:galanin receptor type 2-like n=1 Tax=Brachyhypopomus gauderio TaxID=698409 RepID=UPI0040428AF1
MSNFLTDNGSDALGPGEVDNGTYVSGPNDIERILVPILDSLILVTGLVGHILVIIIICRLLRTGQARGHTAGQVQHSSGTDILLLSLSVADLLLLSCIPYHTVAIVSHHWPFGSFMCKAVSFLGAMCSSASAFTLAALAVSRFLIVVHPSKAFRWRRDGRAKLVTGLLWLPAAVLALPQFSWRTLVSAADAHVTRQDLTCFHFLSDTGQIAYGVCHFMFAFALPLGVIVAAYGKIYNFLQKTRRQRVSQTARLEHYQTQVTHTSVLLVLAFTLCWLPSYGLMLAQLTAHSAVTRPSLHYGAFATFARVTATSSTVVNPILYVFMSQKFRKELKQLLGRD